MISRIYNSVSSACLTLVSITLAGSLLVSSCTSTDVTPGTAIHTHISHEPSASVSNTPSPGKQFLNNNGVTIELTTAYLVIGEIDLRSNCSSSPFASLLNNMLNLVIPGAYAHTISSPTTLGEPLVINIMNNDSEEPEFGDFSPAAGAYCGVTVHAHPADADARDLPETFSMEGLVLHLEGNYDAGGGATAFAIDIMEEPEHADLAFPADLVLSASNLEAEVIVNIAYDTWFNDVTMADLAANDDAAVTQLLENITASMALR
jgi:hypothetical protein